MNDKEEIIEAFRIAASTHAQATENGDYKTANKNYDDIVRSAKYLREKYSILDLEPLLESDNVGVRLWSASYLLNAASSNAVTTLEEIAKASSIHSFTAEMTLKQFRAGKLEL